MAAVMTITVVVTVPDSTITETDPDGAEVTAPLRAVERCEEEVLAEGVPSAAVVRLRTKKSLPTKTCSTPNALIRMIKKRRITTKIFSAEDLKVKS